jgi:hypothetical protein
MAATITTLKAMHTRAISSQVALPRLALLASDSLVSYCTLGCRALWQALHYSRLSFGLSRVSRKFSSLHGTCVQAWRLKNFTDKGECSLGELQGRGRQAPPHRPLRHPGGGRARRQRGDPPRGPRREAAHEPGRRRAAGAPQAHEEGERPRAALQAPPPLDKKQQNSLIKNRPSPLHQRRRERPPHVEVRGAFHPHDGPRLRDGFHEAVEAGIRAEDVLRRVEQHLRKS